MNRDDASLARFIVDGLRAIVAVARDVLDHLAAEAPPADPVTSDDLPHRLMLDQHDRQLSRLDGRLNNLAGRVMKLESMIDESLVRMAVAGDAMGAEALSEIDEIKARLATLEGKG